MGWFRSVAISLVVTLFALALAVPVGASSHGGGHGHDHAAAMSDNGTIGDKCIRDTGEMRRTHMELLKHKRVETVRDGVRMAEESLLSCKTCHTSRTKFCDRCHTYVGVKPDCFECHNYPE